MEERLIGTVSRGIRAGIIRENDDLVSITADSLIKAAKQGNFTINESDILGITEAVVARAQGNYVNLNEIAIDIKNKFETDTIGLIFPILSRNRFATCLKGIAMGVKKIYLMLSYPSDEVGNHLISFNQLDENNINPYSDTLTEEEFRKYFGYQKHPFTGIDYIEYYKEIINSVDCEVEFIFSNNPTTILNYTKDVLVCDIHTRKRTKRILKENNANKVFGLDDILNKSINNSGYNEEYGLLGSNKSTDTSIKLFPRDTQKFVDQLQAKIKELTGVTIEVLVYGDGAFKDPVGKIWELADPVVSPAFTKGLDGVPNEVKLKYLADNDFAHLDGADLKDAISNRIKEKEEDLTGNMAAQGTTPRRLSDLVGSLCDLTSGSGDKGTPFIYIQGYFDNYTK